MRVLVVEDDVGIAKFIHQGLTEAGYDGWIVAEMFVIAGNPASADLNIWRNIEPEPTDAARRALAFMQGQFG